MSPPVQKELVNQVRPSVFYNLLCFIYSGKIDSTNRTECDLGQLLIGAEVVDLQLLHTWCEDTILGNKSLQNWSPLLFLTDNLGTVRLRERILHLARCHEIHIVSTRDWKCLVVSHSQLATKI